MRWGAAILMRSAKMWCSLAPQAEDEDKEHVEKTVLRVEKTNACGEGVPK